jgi:hypothetical protein
MPDGVKPKENKETPKRCKKPKRDTILKNFPKNKKAAIIKSKKPLREINITGSIILEKEEGIKSTHLKGSNIWFKLKYKKTIPSPTLKIKIP